MRKVCQPIRRGFTLIELLVVVTVIIILVSVVLISLSGGREKAKVVRFKQAVHSLQTKAVEVCASNQLDFTQNVGSFGVIPSSIKVAAITGTQNCGQEGSGVFEVNVPSVDISPECLAKIHHTGDTDFFGC